MYSTLVSVTLFASLALLKGVQADFNMPTPQFTQCGSAQISWDQATGPYDVVVVPAADPCGDAIADLGTIDGTSTNWAVNITAGTQVMLSVMDSNDDEAWSGTITVGPSSDSSCLNNVAGAAASASGSASASADPAVRTTLVASATPAVHTPAAVSSSGLNPSDVAGAANAGIAPNSSGALSVRTTAPALALAAVAAVMAAAF